MKQVDGGPAFPCIDAMNVENEGMSLRDYFAALCFASFRINYTTQESVRCAYEAADAMLAERLK